MADDRLVLFDVNALVALALTTHQHHRAAHAFLAGITDEWATCPLTEAALVRLLLNPAVTGSRAAPTTALGMLAALRGDPRWRHLPDDSSLAHPVVQTDVLMGHQQVTDLWLVNLAARHSAALATFDAWLPRWLAPQDGRHVVVIPA